MGAKKFFTIVGIIALVSLLIYFAAKTPESETCDDGSVCGIEEEIINFSSAEYSDLDFGKENITYEARDLDGNLIIGKEWFGVNGKYSEERPLIFDENEYTYWVENDSYIVIPERLIPDIYHEKQKVIAQAYKIENLSDDFRLESYDYEKNLTWIDYDEDHEIVELKIDYTSGEEIKFPINGILVLEYDRRIGDVICKDEGDSMVYSWVPDFYYRQSPESTYYAFIFEEEEKYDWRKINCAFAKIKDLNITMETIIVSFYPNNFFIDEDYELRTGTEDYYANMKTKNVFRGVIQIGN